LIYGANSSIGSELAKQILPEVDNLILFYHKRTDRIKALFTDKKVIAIQSDVRDFDDLQVKIGKIGAEIELHDLGAVFLPSVRSYDHKLLSETSIELVNDIIAVNFLGAIHFIKAVLLLKKMSDSMRIVMTGSNVSRVGLKNGSVYAATKSAVANLARSVSMEEGMSHVLINVVSPGPVETDNSGFDTEYIEFRKEYFETQKRLASLNRIASVYDVISLIKFLTSIENRHITGEEIFVTGGKL
jgi:3-oxoacyl-[acyl-carrier protein] reductase